MLAFLLLLLFKLFEKFPPHNQRLSKAGKGAIVIAYDFQDLLNFSTAVWTLQLYSSLTRWNGSLMVCISFAIRCTSVHGVYFLTYRLVTF